MKPNRPLDYSGDIDPAGLFWSEKLDGFRAIWTGRELVSRQGNPFDVPRSWLDALPAHPLDGELFADSWRTTASAIKAGRWAEVRFHVFDSPVAGNLFDRTANVPPLPDFCRLVDHAPVFSRAHLAAVLDGVAARGGEGIVLRFPDANYRAPWLKVKPLADDEAVILAARFGAYTTFPSGYVLNWQGREILARTTGERIADGTRVTFQYRGCDASGTPRLATVKGPRIFD